MDLERCSAIPPLDWLRSTDAELQMKQGILFQGVGGRKSMECQSAKLTLQGTLPGLDQRWYVKAAHIYCCLGDKEVQENDVP